MDQIKQAQDDVRHGYHSGAPGVLASAIAWGAATATVAFDTVDRAVWVLFIGGMLIHPASILICKLLGSRGGHDKANKLAQLAMANTFWLIFCLPLAYVAYLQRAEWLFPAMLLIIGGRYLTFAPLYGMRIFWVIGFALAGAGFGAGMLALSPVMGAAAGAAIELTFAIVLFVLHKRWVRD
jgi:hypothetical protein